MMAKAKQRKKRDLEQKRALRTAIRKICACGIVLFVCLMLAVWVGNADYKATAIGWAPFAAAVSAILGAWIYLQALKRGLQFMEVSDLGDCKRGEDISFVLRFKNTMPLFFFRIEAYIYMSDLFGNTANESMTTLALAPFEQNEINFTMRFEHIGTYSAGLKKVVVTDYLRLFSVTMENPKKHLVQVTPKLQPLSHIDFSNEASLETFKARKSALSDSLDYSYVRGYVPGDPLKTIHWKLSARTENYMTRIFEVYTNPGVSIIMDFYAPDSRAKTLMGMFDAVAETAFSVGRYAQAQGMETEIHFTNKYGECVREVAWQQSRLPKIIADMPRISNKESRQIDALELLEDQMKSQYGQNNLIVCTANLSSRMISELIEAKARRREPMLFAVVPGDLVGREREDYCAALGRLDAAGIGYVVLSKSEELLGVGA
ncbi:MAG: DUF58 domain-containing protein [Clostridiales Family XIII bacterium]|jgi:uncharacterized protein (DUF58 family)|nr:DUF58 domain-containing protein [Clostridiales Family XIII bacterium]